MIDAALQRNFEIIRRLPGFMERDAYLLFRRLREVSFQPGVPVLEVGVFCGRSLTAIASTFPEVRTVGVDPFFADFSTSVQFDDEAGILKSKSGGQSPKQRLAAIDAVLHDLDSINGTAIAKSVEIRKETEADFLMQNRQRFQLIHIDAEHTFAAVRASLDHLPQTLTENGWLVLDDFLHPGYPDISEAVHTHPAFRRSLWPVVYGANKGVFLWSPQGQGAAPGLRRRIAENYRSAGAIVREMHDGAPMVDMPGLGQPIKRRKTLAQRLQRSLGFGRGSSQP